MVYALLPTTAAAFSLRTPPIVDLSSTADLSWLKNTIKSIGKIRTRRCSNVGLQTQLEQALSSPDAIWMLCSLMIQLLEGPNRLIQAIYNYRMIHINAYVVYVNEKKIGHTKFGWPLFLETGCDRDRHTKTHVKPQHPTCPPAVATPAAEIFQQIAFKLTPESISELIEYHRDVYLVNTAASRSLSPEETEKLRNEFVESVNRFVYRTSAKALLNIEPNGSGELSFGNSNKVKTAIMGLFPSPPSPPDITSASPSDITNSPPSDIISSVQIFQNYSFPTPYNQNLTSVTTHPQYNNDFGHWGY
ncbi:MAG: hypothetical protein M1839_003648 [Geoglossum umbratile]|nr:MAG: hypothetical protein M1839_003648 [Geoglossum umbratile]